MTAENIQWIIITGNWDCFCLWCIRLKSQTMIQEIGVSEKEVGWFTIIRWPASRIKYPMLGHQNVYPNFLIIKTWKCVICVCFQFNLTLPCGIDVKSVSIKHLYSRCRRKLEKSPRLTLCLTFFNTSVSAVLYFVTSKY